MIFWETIRLAFSALRANLLRTLLTILGMSIGIFSIVAVMTVIGGLRSEIEGGLNVLGANSFQVQKYPAINFSDPRSRFANRANISYRQARRFHDLMATSAGVSLQVFRGGRRVFAGDDNTNPNIVLAGSDELFLQSLNLDLAHGRNLTESDLSFARGVVVIGHDIVQRLFPNKDPLGEEVRIDNQRYTVVGVLAEKGAAFGGSQDNRVLIPLTRFLNVYGQNRISLNLVVKAPSQAALETTLEQAIGAMRLVRGCEPEDDNDFEIFTNESLVDTFNQVTRVVAVGAFVISAIALLAAGVGVMNIMLVSVTERTHEIGIRKSVGATRRIVLFQFLIEAVTLSIVGAFIGVLLGIGVGNLLAMLMHASFVFPWAWAFGGLGICGGVGVIFGIYPAWRAAMLDPIEALRYE